MRRGPVVAAWTLAAAVAASACGSRSTPSSPTLAGAVPALTNLSISGFPAVLRLGGSAALTATATFSDGSRREVPAVWSTSNPAVAYVTGDPATGRRNLLVGVTAGETDITATWTPASTTARIVVREPASLGEISGVVHEAGGRPGLTLPGVRVEIAGGPHGGLFVVTDDLGRFDFPDIMDTGVELVASRQSYETTRVNVVTLSRGAGITIALPPAARIVERVFDGTLAPDCVGRDAARSLFLTPRHDGILVVSNARVNAFEGGYFLYRNSTGLASFSTEAGRAFSLDAGAEYELRVIGYCFPTDTGTFRVVFTVPE